MSEINPVEFGRLVGLVEGLRSDIADFKVTAVSKIEDHEKRIAAVEQARAIRDVPSFGDRVVDKALWGLLLAGLGVVFKLFGVG